MRSAWVASDSDREIYRNDCERWIWQYVGRHRADSSTER